MSSRPEDPTPQGGSRAGRAAACTAPSGHLPPCQPRRLVLQRAPHATSPPQAGGGSARCPRAHTSRFLSRIKLFLDVLMKEVLHPESRSPDGVRFHCIDVYLDELSKVGGKEVSHVPSASAAGTGKGGGWDRASAALQTPRVLGAGARGWHCGTSHRRA